MLLLPLASTGSGRDSNMQYKRKTKKQRQSWWNSLTPEQQDYHLSRWQSDKSAKRKAKSRIIMKKLGLSYDCQKCIHGLTQSCTDTLKNGCIYFADEINEVYGPAYAA